MSILSWGKCTIQHTQSINGAPDAGANWDEWPVPKEDSTKITPTQGAKKEATEEGGDLVDVRYGKTKHALELEVFVKKGEARPIEDNDGPISGEHAFRIIPEDDTCEGIQIDRCTGVVDESYSTADGKMLKYTFDVLKPASGKKVKPYTANGLVVTPSALYFSAEADDTGKTITATSTGNVTATSSESWCTVTTSAKVATVEVAANATGAARTAYVSITADGKTTQVAVMQIPA